MYIFIFIRFLGYRKEDEVDAQPEKRGMDYDILFVRLMRRDKHCQKVCHW